MENKSSLVIGYLGEVGSALFDILRDHYEIVAGIDMNNNSVGMHEMTTFDLLHICVPYKGDFDFEHMVHQYQLKYKPAHTIIHSTVPVGVSRALQAIHSPIRGLHPDLKQGILTFPKFLGGPGADQVADYFRKAGIKVILLDKADTAEAAKLFDTEYYRMCIEFAQRVNKYCQEHDLSFHEVYTLPNLTYNQGYKELKHEEFVRPVLQAIMTEIGGHCVRQNKELLND